MLERNEALPFKISGCTVHGNITLIVLPDGQLAGGVITDVAVNIRVHKVLARSRKPGDGSRKFLPVPGAIDFDKRILKTSRLGRCPAQCPPKVAFGSDGTVNCNPIDQFNRWSIFHGNQLTLGPRLLHLAPKFVPAGAIVKFLNIQILHVVMQIRQAPPDSVVMPHNNARLAG